MRSIVASLALLSPFRLFGLERHKLSVSIQALFWIALVVAGLSLVNSAYDFYRYSGTDLRVRIVGTRAMLRGINPYLLDYSPKLPEILQDPDQYSQGLSRCPYPPSLLLFYAPLSPLPYPAARAISMGLEWIALIATIALLARTFHYQRARAIFVISALVGFCGSYFWRLHVERGQYHIFITLLLAWGIYEVLKTRKDSWQIGIPFGLALALRPTILVILLFLFLQKFRKATFCAIGTAVAVVLLTLPFGGLQFWQDWQSLVNRYEDRVVVVKDGAQPIKERLPAEGFYPDRMLLDAKTNNTSAVNILVHALDAVKVDLPPKNVKSLTRIVMFAIILIFLLLFIWGDRRKAAGIRFALFSSVLLSVIAEFIAPVRNGYADVQLLLVVALSMPLLLRPGGRFLGFIVVLGFLASSYLPFKERIDYDLARVLLVIAPVTILYSGILIKRIREPTGSKLLAG